MNSAAAFAILAMFIPIKGANGPTATPFARVPENSSLILYSQKLPSEGRWYPPTCVTPAITSRGHHHQQKYTQHF